MDTKINNKYWYLKFVILTINVHSDIMFMSINFSNMSTVQFIRAIKYFINANEFIFMRLLEWANITVNIASTLAFVYVVPINKNNITVIFVNCRYFCSNVQLSRFYRFQLARRTHESNPLCVNEVWNSSKQIYIQI